MKALVERPTGTRVLGLLLVVVLVTAVLPPLGAWTLNQWRVRETAERAQEIASRLDGRRAELAAAARQGLAVVCGPGRLPDHGPTGQWVGRAVQALEVLGEALPTDAWGRCFLVNVDGLADDVEAPIWVMSAGADGRVETMPDSEVVVADDIGRRVR